ncbi:uncharacterized protein FOMMEDRAFT_171203 [Fomitiporia mediterranea MF3/22]|uniref:uncharacterized protein n=1 Tax=Fomitiporia mediterranea (strain MF3/22) TaxID=694068 RepID=UPI00044076F2|nr:uncharacterized protein FOMMEDRAFT_171203 [Fomitiporia mediterranea MF3/22]EJC98283.1 hypothetical protein FOMMEDRAFT_171203 [Fomitiporia mediterranea MF3/22]
MFSAYDWLMLCSFRRKRKKEASSGSSSFLSNLLHLVFFLRHHHHHPLRTMRKEVCTFCRGRKVRCELVLGTLYCQNCADRGLECSGPMPTEARLKKKQKKATHGSNEPGCHPPSGPREDRAQAQPTAELQPQAPSEMLPALVASAWPFDAQVPSLAPQTSTAEVYQFGNVLNVESTTPTMDTGQPQAPFFVPPPSDPFIRPANILGQGATSQDAYNLPDMAEFELLAAFAALNY